MQGRIDLETLQRMVIDGDIETVIAVLPDMYGRLVGKRFNARYFIDDVAEHGMHACDYLLACDMEMDPVPGYAFTSWAKGYGDFRPVPDFGTMRVASWLEKSAIVICDVMHDTRNELVPFAPRGILQRQVERAAKSGYMAMGASELELYVFKDSYETVAEKGFIRLEPIGRVIEDYHILQGTKEEYLIGAIRSHLERSGVPVESSKGEWGPGQEEINVRYADPLTMADWHVILKNGCKEIAHSLGQALTFMAKWRYDLAGSSSHIHASLWDAAGKTSLFLDRESEHGMSALMRHYVAGQLAHAREITWFLAPYINSYKRFQVGTFAPTKAIWSLDNRTAGFRLCGASSKAIRIECRIGGADLNPYLAFAALIAAGLAGIEQKLELEAPYVGDAYQGKALPEVPKTLREATELMRMSKMLRAAFGDDVIDHYVHTAEWEQFEYDRRITDWELKRGFERY